MDQIWSKMGNNHGFPSSLPSGLAGSAFTSITALTLHFLFKISFWIPLLTLPEPRDSPLWHFSSCAATLQAHPSLVVGPPTATTLV